MLHIHPIKAVCCAEERLENHCFVLYPIIQYCLIQHQTLNTQKVILYHAVVTYIQASILK